MAHAKPQEPFVCARHFKDYALKGVIESRHANFLGLPCSFCQKGMAVPLNIVAEHIARCLPLEWEEVDVSILGGDEVVSNLVWDTNELLVECCDVDDPKILEELGAAPALLKGPWLQKGSHGEHHHQMSWAWEEFRKYVMHERRYSFFHQSSYEMTKQRTEETLFGEISPHEMLNILGGAVSDENLTRQTQAGAEIYYRARVGYFSKEDEIREPKPQKARASNRMSPAGIPMFYGCPQQQAALREIYDDKWAKEGDIVTVGKFEMTQPIWILDLSKVPNDVPSLFDESNNQRRGILAFLRDFAGEIAKPIIKDGRENIEYVPTQFLTEYFRMGAPSIDDEIGGIEYLSAHRAYGSQGDEKWTCVALFDSKCLNLTGVDYFRVSVKQGKGEKPEVGFHQVHLSTARES